MSKTHATQRQVAEAAGVSQETVSQALRGVGRVGSETRERVLEAARRVGYCGNPLARAIRRRRFGAVGIIRCEQSGYSYLPDDFVKGIQPSLQREQLRLSLAQLPERFESDEAAIETTSSILHGLMVDGLIVNMTESVPERLKRAIAATGLPAVWLNARLDSSCVLPDERGASLELAKFLAARTSAPPVFITQSSAHSERIGGHGTHFSVEERRQGYFDAMASLGLKAECLSSDSIDARLFKSLVAAAGSEGRRAFVCYGQREALSLLLAARESGIDLDRRVAACYFSHTPFWCDAVDSCLRYVKIPFMDMAGTLISLLLDKMERGEDFPAAPVRIPYDISLFPRLLEHSSYYEYPEFL